MSEKRTEPPIAKRLFDVSTDTFLKLPRSSSKPQCSELNVLVQPCPPPVARKVKLFYEAYWTWVDGKRSHIHMSKLL